MITLHGPVLVIAPHPDDAELGCGATIVRLAIEGEHITILMLSDRGEPVWFSEAITAAKILDPHGLVKVETLHQTVFHMSSERQAILRALEAYRDKLQPKTVFVPAQGDLHQDHACVATEAARVFKTTTLLGYEIVRSNVRFQPMLFAEVDETGIDRKVEAVHCYATQRDKFYTQRNVIEGLARVRGAMIDVPLAEAFTVERMLA